MIKIKDIDKSIYYSKLAANQYYMDAIYRLGMVYYDLKNIDLCLKYLTIAADNDNEFA